MFSSRPLSKLRFALARKRERYAASTKDKGSFGSKILSVSLSVVVIVICAVRCYFMDTKARCGMMSYYETFAALILLGFFGYQLLRAVARDAAAMSTYVKVTLAMLIGALAEAWLANFVYARLAAGFLTGATGEDMQMLAYPNAVVPFLVAMLYGGPVALAIGLITSTAISIVSGGVFNVEAFLVAFPVAICASCILSFEAPKLIRRTQMARIAALVGALQVVILTLILFRLGMQHRQLLLHVGVFYAFEMFSVAILAFFILPLAEHVLGRAGNITLANIVNLESPLLRRMSLEAPGTYHHAMMVGDLAKAAAEAIGADGILSRAGAYYHDIGKLGQPHYFMENQSGFDAQGGLKNPHDALPPNISPNVIMSHVKEGMVLAKIHHLPPVLTRFIETHHGTSIVRWFLIKEQKRLESERQWPVPADDITDFFRYPGPLPETREETIVSLADSVEAASRSMRFFDRDKIEKLVCDIIQDRWTDGQLAKSELTNAELDKVRESFISTLVPLLHGRLPYPSQK